MTKGALWWVLAAILWVGGVPAASALGSPGGGFGSTTGDGATVTLTTSEIKTALNEAAAAATAPKPRPYYEYKTQINCAAGNEATDSGCGTAASACDNGQFQAVVLRRLMVPKPGGGYQLAPPPEGLWQGWGLTCSPQLIPGTNLPTLANVMTAFREIDFAKGGLSIQPVGNVTLVNLATYFEATWPEAGVGPDETDVSDLMGYRLEIQPVVRSFTYVYGDGDSSEPTESMGGPYPDGDIRHTYEQKGSMATRVDTVYGGRFRFGQGQWMTIPGTVTVEGTPVTLEVREAKARLYGSANPAPHR
ncbi:hypothetical protein BCF74_12827 [Knoellia remsis]|uniref:Uncharacterized protein n=1 Tax=Knoellia remsis TaxID=407159 RepID=A0A2T0U6B6_9MICO|nr:hypothetical protein [Knoellia remsis]PRY53408.1 hypothetical protein BCF74_12827 [Knoellia remsis]